MLNSHIVSASINGSSVNNLREGVLVTFKHLTPKTVRDGSVYVKKTSPFSLICFLTTFANFRRTKTKWSVCSGIFDNIVSLLDLCREGLER